MQTLTVTAACAVRGEEIGVIVGTQVVALRPVSIQAAAVRPDSNFYISRARAGVDPFHELHAHADDWDFATCGQVLIEVCRGRRDPNVRRRFRQGQGGPAELRPAAAHAH